ncbi:MAG TPA: hypothetical protein VKT76_08395 [Bradyrhizobium sp.]|nr:hypothetical protein [Bradyrhizobium sp.]
MLSRARLFAAVTLLVGCFAGPAAWAQVQNLEAGKTPSQLFAGTCNACHKSPRGLLKTVSTASLPGFLREHYTTSGEMASQLSAFVIANGAAAKLDPKQATGNDQDRQGRKLRSAPSEEAARPDAESPPPAEGGRPARRRFARPGEVPEEVRPASAGPAQAAIERGPDGRRLSAKQRRSRPDAEEAPVVKDEPPKAGPTMSDQAKGEAVKPDNGASERTKPDSESKPMEAKSVDTKPDSKPMEPAKDPNSGDKPVARRDPVQPLTPAPAVAVTPPPSMTPGSEASSASAPRVSAAPEPPAVTASAPPILPSAGPPAPPISR